MQQCVVFFFLKDAAMCSNRDIWKTETSPQIPTDLDGRADEAPALPCVGDVADGPDRGDPLGPEPLHRLVHVLLRMTRGPTKSPNQKSEARWS